MSESPTLAPIRFSRRDGTCQAGRILAALAPETFAVDDRGVADWLRYLREYARHLIYYDTGNLPAGRWSELIPYSDSEIDALAGWIGDEGRAGVPCPLEDLRPHVALLVAFLKCLEGVQVRINEFTGRHLEYYTRELLRLTPRPGVGGRVHVAFQPVDGQEDLLIPAGTLLEGGRSDSGSAIRFKTDRDLVVSQARVVRLMSLHATRSRIGLRELQRSPTLGETAFRRTSSWWNAGAGGANLPRDNTFLALLQLSLGDPNPGDPLPVYSGQVGTLAGRFGAGFVDDKSDSAIDGEWTVAITATLLNELAEVVSGASAPVFAPSSLLGFVLSRWSLPVFRKLMELRFQVDLRVDEVKSRWERVNVLIGKVNPVHLDDFETNLGLPDGVFDGLEEVGNVYDLDRRVSLNAVDHSGDPYVEFVNERLKMTVAAFKEVMEVVDRARCDWQLIRDILRKGGVVAGSTHVDLRRYQANRWDLLLAEFVGPLGGGTTVAGRKLANLDLVYEEILRVEATFNMPIEDFARIRSVHGNPQSKPWEWEEVFGILEKARFRKDSAPDRGVLLKKSSGERDIRARLESMVEAAVGAQNGRVFDLIPRNVRDLQKITQGLYLKVEEYEMLRRMIPRNGDEIAVQPDWEAAAEILVAAQWRRHGRAPGTLGIESWENLHRADDATRVTPAQGLGDHQAAVGWKTLGDGARSDDATVPARFGLMIESPLLALSEGDRTITLSFQFASEGWSSVWATLGVMSGPAPFSVFLSTGKGLSPFGVSKWSLVAEVRRLDLEVHLGPGDPKIVPLPPGLDLPGEFPLVQLVLNEGGIRAWKWYDLLQSVTVADVRLGVEVTGLRSLVIENDDAVLDPKKPFDLFGGRPSSGARFRFAHREICTKALESLSVGMEYQNLPKNLDVYYAGYSTKVTAQGVQARLLLLDRGEEWPKESPVALVGAPFRGGAPVMIPLFDPATIALDGLHWMRVSLRDQLEVVPRDESNPPKNLTPVRSWSRHWILELGEPDLQHSVFPTEMQRVSLANVAAMAKDPAVTLTLNAPYTPKVKKIVINYRANASLASGGDSINGGRVYHLEPFGYLPVNPEGATAWNLLPQWNDEGALFVGLEGVKAPQNLSLLLQMVGGAKEAGSVRPSVRWSCLDGNKWRPLDGSRVLQDTTRGFLNSGLVEFQLDPVELGTRMPAGLFWIRLAVDRNSGMVPNLITILSQAVIARCSEDLQDQELAPDQISGLVTPRFEIKKVLQPFGSFGGRPAESSQASRLRISERLRHKDRALTSWDYERLVLEAFPEALQALCLPVNSMADPALRNTVQVLLIPNPRVCRLLDPYDPSLGEDILADVQSFLEARCPPGISLSVRNPRYVPLQVRLSVRLRSGKLPDYYRPQLSAAISRFLTPWAFGDSRGASFGISRQRSSQLVHFVERLPYVDYVAQVRRYAFREGIYVELLESDEPGTADPEADVVLVSAPRHEIDFVGEERFVVQSFEGIGYMRIGYEFTSS